MTVTNQTNELSAGTGHLTFHNDRARARPVTNELGKRATVAHVSPEKEKETDRVDKASSGCAAEEAFRGMDQPLKLMDIMQKSNKYRLLNYRNKTLQDA